MADGRRVGGAAARGAVLRRGPIKLAPSESRARGTAAHAPPAPQLHAQMRRIATSQPSLATAPCRSSAPRPRHRSSAAACSGNSAESAPAISLAGLGGAAPQHHRRGTARDSVLGWT